MDDLCLFRVSGVSEASGSLVGGVFWADGGYNQ